MTKMSQLRPGQRALVSSIHGSGAVHQRLLDMGLVPRAEVTVERLAPAGDPIWIKLAGYQLSLRRSEAASILVTSCE